MHCVPRRSQGTSTPRPPFDCDLYFDFVDTLQHNSIAFDRALPFVRFRISIAGSDQVT